MAAWYDNLTNQLGQSFIGVPGGYQQFPLFKPQQTEALDEILSSGRKALQNPTAGFEPIEKQARERFSQQTVPSLAERFTSGTGGTRFSPSFASQIGQAGAGLETDIAALKSQYGLSRENNILNQLKLGLTPQFENLGVEGSKGFAPSFIENAAPDFTKWLLNWATGKGGEEGAKEAGSTAGDTIAKVIGGAGGTMAKQALTPAQQQQEMKKMLDILGGNTQGLEQLLNPQQKREFFRQTGLKDTLGSGAATAAASAAGPVATSVISKISSLALPLSVKLGLFGLLAAGGIYGGKKLYDWYRS